MYKKIMLGMLISLNVMAADFHTEANKALALADTCNAEEDGVFPHLESVFSCVDYGGEDPVIFYANRLTKCAKRYDIMTKIAKTFPICAIASFTDKQTERSDLIARLFNGIYGMYVVTVEIAH